MDVVVIGLGYVGAVTSACLAELDHRVTGVDVDQLKVDEIEGGRSPIVEPQLDELIARGRSSEKLHVSTTLDGAGSTCDAIVVCVGTPPRSDGTVDLDQIKRVTVEIGRELGRAQRYVDVVYRSTVPPGTISELCRTLEVESGLQPERGFGVAMAPEFLREGSGVDDFFDPPLTVAGVRDDRAFATVSELFASSGPIHRLTIEAAESLKYACNAFHAVKITFANEIGRILAALDIDAREVMKVLCEDEKLNISPAYLRPGFAFGGSCLPKDLRALMHVARVQDVDVPMLRGVDRSNSLHAGLAARRILDYRAREVALLGLSFKAETDDLRESPLVELAETLVGKGVHLQIYDPIVNPERLIGANLRYMQRHLPHLSEMLKATADEALEGTTAAVVGSGDARVVAALHAAPPQHVLDLNGGLGPTVEALPGYEGLAW
jgi:GDP-mannose 6-dehydrogenase